MPSASTPCLGTCQGVACIYLRSGLAVQLASCNPTCARARSCMGFHAARRYETVAAEVAAMQRPYEALAELLNCRPENIAIVTSATVGWQQVSSGKPPAHLSLGRVQLTVGHTAPAAACHLS